MRVLIIQIRLSALLILFCSVYTAWCDHEDFNLISEKGQRPSFTLMDAPFTEERKFGFIPSWMYPGPTRYVKVFYKDDKGIPHEVKKEMPDEVWVIWKSEKFVGVHYLPDRPTVIRLDYEDDHWMRTIAIGIGVSALLFWMTKSRDYDA